MVVQTYPALKEARKARLQVAAPVSSVQMEYLHHMKPAAMQKLAAEIIGECRKYAEDVEFIADDASRGNPEFIAGMINWHDISVK